MPGKRRTYDRVARDLGVSERTLKNWVTRVRAERSGAKGWSKGSDEELNRLRAENEELRMERDFLRRSMVFWVKEAMK